MSYFGAMAGVLGQQSRPDTVHTFLQSNSDETDGTVITFSGESLGAASADRYIVVAVYGRVPEGTTQTLTVAGVSATQAITKRNAASGNNFVVSLWCAAVPTGTTGDVVVTWSASAWRTYIGMWAVTGLASATAEDTDFDDDLGADPAGSLDVSAGSSQFCAVVTNWQTQGVEFDSPLVQDYDAGMATGRFAGAAYDSASADAAFAVGVTETASSAPAAVWASWAK